MQTNEKRLTCDILKDVLRLHLLCVCNHFYYFLRTCATYSHPHATNTYSYILVCNGTHSAPIPKNVQSYGR